MIGLVTLAMPNWLSTSSSWTPSAVPPAPLQAPAGEKTVAAIPHCGTVLASALCSFDASAADTGSSTSDPNALAGKAVGAKDG